MSIVEPTEPMECQICFDAYNKSTRKPIKCLYCSKQCCKSCILGNITANWDSSPNHCLFCNKDWEITFLYENFTKNEIDNTFKSLKAFKNFQVEQSKLPETQEKARLIHQVELNAKEIKQIDDETRKLRAQISFLNSRKDDLLVQNNQIHRQVYYGEEDDNLTNFKYTIKCPTVNCKFLLDKKFYCDYCDKQFCKKCLEEKPKRVVAADEDTDDEEEDDGHTCNADTLETMKMIRKTSKPCPGCSTSIHKIDGCDQMWCPICKKGFSWKTGKIETGRIHNPEYFRWLRDHQETEEEFQVPEQHNNCVFPDDAYFSGMLVRLRTDERITYETASCMLEVFRLGIDMEHLVERFQREDERKENTLLCRRIEFMNNKIDEETWKKELVKIENNHAKAADTADIHNLVKIVILENIWKIIDCYNNRPEFCVNQINNSLIEFQKIRIYANEGYHLLSSKKVHSGKRYKIDEHWRLH